MNNRKESATYGNVPIHETLSRVARNLDEVPTHLGSVLDQAVNKINTKPDIYEPKSKTGEKNYKETMLEWIAKAFVDLTYEEMNILAEGIRPDPNVLTHIMADAIHKWAKDYKGEQS